jgi:diguanylate cyclase (GGDEF)-like protein/PAS domain S-box-containing protein
MQRDPETILLIQADARESRSVREALGSAPRFRLLCVESSALGIACLAGHRSVHSPDPPPIAAILVDLSVPDCAGMEIVDRLLAAAPQTPIVVLCTAKNELVATAAIQRGAQDYLLKEHLSNYLLEKTLVAVIERASIMEALFDEKERAEVTLNSIGDAVICTNLEGCVTYLNLAAQRLTGWAKQEAVGLPLEQVFKIIDSVTRETIANPMAAATAKNATVGLTPNSVMVRRDGTESAIEDSSAPIHDRRGQVTGAVMVFHDVSTARALTLKLAYTAQHDGLTDLPNRSLLNDRLGQAIAAAMRRRGALAVLYLDLDRFKVINDSLGHRVGDRLLQSVALRLRESVRGSDTVSRLGGDEFVVLLAEVVHEQDAAHCADKLLKAIRQPHLLDDHEVHVSGSIGIAVHPADGNTVEALLQNADSAMYEAKKHGRNNYQFYRSDLNSSASARQALESGLRHAVQREELELHYQPIMSLRSGAADGVEALLRWQHPTLGLLCPDQFISIAEESGLIVPIGRWVLREACRQVHAWHAAGLPNLRLAVNISAVELRAEEFAANVGAILAETGFDPRYLELELTETFLMQDSTSTALVLLAIKNLGVQLALDDFGTGYSSLSYMRRFPIDTLKVDRSFIRDLTHDPNDASVVSALISLGKGLHMRVVAEGVEAADQLVFLKDHDCAEAQGYFFSRPLRAPDFADWMRDTAASAVPA